ncbi:MBL fold metallo-hydrolase, partial [Chloroflexota bacterium]
MTKTYRIKPLPLMKMELDKGRFTYLQNYGTKIWVPIFCWFIEGADQNILVDSGASAEEALRYTGNRAENIMSFEEALGSVGLKPEDIDVVIQTHLHWDHCANTPKCKNAMILVSEDELKVARSPHPFMSGPYKKELLNGINFTPVKVPYKVVPGIELVSAA